MKNKATRPLLIAMSYVKDMNRLRHFTGAASPGKPVSWGFGCICLFVFPFKKTKAFLKKTSFKK